MGSRKQRNFSLLLNMGTSTLHTDDAAAGLRVVEPDRRCRVLTRNGVGRRPGAVSFRPPTPFPHQPPRSFPSCKPTTDRARTFINNAPPPRRNLLLPPLLCFPPISRLGVWTSHPAEAAGQTGPSDRSAAAIGKATGRPMESRALLHARPAALPHRAGLRLHLPLLRPRAVSRSPAAKPALQSPLLASRGPFLQRHDAVLGNGFVKRRAASAGGDVSFRAQAAASAAVPAPQPEESTKKLLGIDVKTLKKIVPLGLMFFCILFNYTILRDTKDVLVVTAKGSSAEIIPFLKTWVNLPMAIGFMLLYTKLSNVLSRDALFYTVIFPFIAFFGAFAFVLYPLRDVIHPTALADKLLAALGPSFLGPVAILRIWSFCLFYVMAELWGSVVISVLFWGFANQVSLNFGFSYQYCHVMLIPSLIIVKLDLNHSLATNDLTNLI
jgi:hypothetical protein